MTSLICKSKVPCDVCTATLGSSKKRIHAEDFTKEAIQLCDKLAGLNLALFVVICCVFCQLTCVDQRKPRRETILLGKCWLIFGGRTTLETWVQCKAVILNILFSPVQKKKWPNKVAKGDPHMIITATLD